MKSLGIIKDDVYNDFHFRDNDEERRLKITETEEYQDEVTKRFSIEVAKQALINASHNGKIILYSGSKKEINKYQYCGSDYLEIYKQSITDESNIPTL